MYRQLDVIGSWAFIGAHLAAYVRVPPAFAARFDLESMARANPLGSHADVLADVAAGAVRKAVLTG
ncbi:hypothetical protein [Streptomyces sp. NPDC020571]|uniref:hypothetical protein n=1 Tax=Streptomyces sp. NPDC020571 TaxID=3365079 RepID=UPI00379A66C0